MSLIKWFFFTFISKNWTLWNNLIYLIYLMLYDYRLMQLLNLFCKVLLLNKNNKKKKVLLLANRKIYSNIIRRIKKKIIRASKRSSV